MDKNQNHITKELHQSAYDCLMEMDIGVKLINTLQLHRHWPQKCASQISNATVKSVIIPGRPLKPALVEQKEVPSRSLGSDQGRAAFIHAICHIEFNAINLALDAVYRFRGMPESYYSDWLKVAKEEAEHFNLLENRLKELGYSYGDFVAHNGLWEMACRTEHDILHRMALVPRVLEARGLDVTPGIIKRLEAVGDHKTAEILKLILREEVGHVKIGSYWYMSLCQQRGLEAIPTFKDLLQEYYIAPLCEPLNHQARVAAGFTEQEISILIEPFI